MSTRVKLHSARELYCPICKRWHRSPSKAYINHYSYLIERKENPIGLYESFHNAKPIRTRKVHYVNPKGTLIKVGRISEIKYRPEFPSEHEGVEFYHRSGDTGEEVLPSNLILATDSKGENFYLIKDKKSKRPYFSGRGIIG